MRPRRPRAVRPPRRKPTPAPHRMDPVRKWILIFSAFLLLLLVWYLLADRYTPFTTQARVNAFVVPIAPQVLGEILSVDVRTNQMVKKGQQLARVDPARYELAVASAEAQLALAQQSLRVSSSTVDAAAAGLEAAKAALVKDTQNEVRLKRIEDGRPRRGFAAVAEVGHDFRIEGEAHVDSAKANFQKAVEALGPRGEEPAVAFCARRLGQGKAGLAIYPHRGAGRRPGDRPADRRGQLRPRPASR